MDNVERMREKSISGSNGRKKEHKMRITREEYLRRMKERGNNQEFINYQSKLWEVWVNGCKNDKYAERCIELQSNQHLEDVLPNLK